MYQSFMPCNTFLLILASKKGQRKKTLLGLGLMKKYSVKLHRSFKSEKNVLKSDYELLL